MKILYYSPHPQLNYASPSGSGTHMREMVNAFRKQGHEVEICIMGGETLSSVTQQTIHSSKRKRLLKKCIPPVIWSTLKDLALIKFDKEAETRLEKIVKQYKPDFIYERGHHLMVSGCKIAEKYGIFHSIEINAPFREEKIEMEGKNLSKKSFIRKEKFQFEQADQIVVVSSALKDYYSQKHPSQKEKIIITPNAVDPDKIQVDPSKLQGLAQEFKGKTVIGFVGSIFPYHGVDELIRCVSMLAHKKNKQVHLLIVGGGLILEDLKELSRQIGASQLITFTGNVPPSEVYNYINLMDIAVLAKTKWYCSPVKIFEYGALGKAIVSIDTKSIRDVITGEQDALLVDGSPESLANALEKLIGEPEFRKQLAENFQRKVLAEHTWNKMAELILNTYRKHK